MGGRPGPAPAADPWRDERVAPCRWRDRCGGVRLEHWGGDDELAVLASVLGAHFVVFEEELGFQMVEIDDGNEFAVHLFNTERNIHFNLLRPRVP